MPTTIDVNGVPDEVPVVVNENIWPDVSPGGSPFPEDVA